MKFFVLITVLLATYAKALRVVNNHNIRTSTVARSFKLNENAKQDTFDPLNLNSDTEAMQAATTSSDTSLLTFGLLAAMVLVPSEPAQALDSVPHFLQGKVASLIHPAVNLLLFFTSLYSAKLGLQWKEIRSIGAQLKDLNDQLPTLSTGKAKAPLGPLIESLTSESSALAETDAAVAATLQKDIASLKSALNIDSEITALTTKRKELISAKPKDKHELTGSILLGAGVSVSILGAFNTFMRTGKLFPGPHLYAGMAITILWAVAAAMVPQMQKGNESARAAHIAANFLNLALFAWQIPTGWQITQKVIEKAPW